MILSQTPPVFHTNGRVTVKAKAFPHSYVGPVYGCIDIAPGELTREEDITARLFVQHCSARLTRCLCIGDRREWLVLDDDLFQGVFG